MCSPVTKASSPQESKTRAGKPTNLVNPGLVSGVDGRQWLRAVLDIADTRVEQQCGSPWELTTERTTSSVGRPKKKKKVGGSGGRGLLSKSAGSTGEIQDHEHKGSKEREKVSKEEQQKKVD